MDLAPRSGAQAKVAGRSVAATRLVPQPGWTASPLSPALSSRHRFGCRGGYIFKLKFTQQKKTCRVGMSSHWNFMCARKDVQCGMFERVVSSSFKDKWEIK